MLRRMLSALSFAAEVALVVLVTAFSWVLPRLARLVGPLFRRGARWAGAEWRRAHGLPIRTALAALVLALLLVNGVVRLTGGRPGYLSTDRLEEKVAAVLRLAAHLPFHLFGTCGAAPDDLLSVAARETGVSFELLRAVAEVESGFRPHVISHAGAMGMMQLMPTTARAMKVRDPFDAGDNARGGARYLAHLSERYGGDLERVVAAYHAGPTAVPVRGPLRVGAGTRRYVRRVVARRAELAAARVRPREP